MEYFIGLGIIFALIAALSSGVEKILRKKISVNIDSLTYAFIFQGAGAIFALPLFIIKFQLPSNPNIWFLVVLSGFLWAGFAFTLIKSYKYLEVSVIAPVSRARIILFLFLAIIFLNETLNSNKVIGTFLIFGGLVYLSYNKNKVKTLPLNNPGIPYLFASIFLIVFALLIDKFASSFFNPGAYTFLVYFIASLFLFPFILLRKHSIKPIFRSKYLILMIITSFLSVTYYFLILNAYRFAEASVIIPLTELSGLVAVFGGIFFLGEKSYLKKKIISTLIIIIGTVFISLA